MREFILSSRKYVTPIGPVKVEIYVLAAEDDTSFVVPEDGDEDYVCLNGLQLLKNVDYNIVNGMLELTRALYVSDTIAMGVKA